MEDEQCDLDHIHDTTGEQRDICDKEQAVTEAERDEVSELMNGEVEVAGRMS